MGRRLMPLGQQVWQLPATELGRLIRARELSPVEVVEQSLSRIQALDPDLGSFCAVDPDGARREARRIESVIARDGEVGALAGLPVAVKDLIFTRGLRTVGGSTAYRNFVPDEDDVVVERVRAADGIVVGKTNVPPFGFGPGTDNELFGPTRNPWALDHTPGGSSGGSAAAVAAGLVPLALGSDGGGSIRIPSSFCGIVGMKPTFGTVPLYPGCRDAAFPGFSGWETLEHIGPMARTVSDAALLLDVIAGHDVRDRHAVPRPTTTFLGGDARTLRGVRIGYATTLGAYASIDSVVESCFNLTIDRLRSTGAILQPVELDLTDPGPMYETTIALEADIEGLRELATRNPGSLNARIDRMLAYPWTFSEASRAISGRKELFQKVRRCLDQFDLLVTPTVAVPPYPTDRQPAAMVNGIAVSDPRWLLWLTMPFNLTGHPAISLPSGRTESGLPIGVQIVGRPFEELAVLGAARTLEQLSPWAEVWPASAMV
jgi:aspartyl-tRNA(Asn)/glutamyl-tRNA(Gln) amidotransferase subunit A